MTSQEKKILLQKYFRGQCSETEKQQVLLFLQQADKDVELNQLLDETWLDLKLFPELPDQISENIFEAVSARTHVGKNRQSEKKVAEKAKEKVKQLPKAINPLWRIAAAVTLLIVFSGIGYQWFTYNPDQVRQTAYGQTTAITLPDKSVVMLNGNSRIRYKKNWNSNTAREVWLEGEGFFKVVHTVSHQKFVVHTTDELAVEVLGTTFTVAKRKTGTRVVLNEGKVRLNVTKADTSAVVDLEPGDLVQVTANESKVEKRQVNADNYSSWTMQVLSFSDTPLREVIALLEETYGLKITVADKSLYDRRISGSTPVTKNLDLFFIGLEQTFDLKITRKGNKVLFEQLPLKTS